MKLKITVSNCPKYSSHVENCLHDVPWKFSSKFLWITLLAEWKRFTKLVNRFSILCVEKNKFGWGWRWSLGFKAMALRKLRKWNQSCDPQKHGIMKLRPTQVSCMVIIYWMTEKGNQELDDRQPEKKRIENSGESWKIRLEKWHVSYHKGQSCHW